MTRVAATVLSPLSALALSPSGDGSCGAALHAAAGPVARRPGIGVGWAVRLVTLVWVGRPHLVRDGDGPPLA